MRKILLAALLFASPAFAQVPPPKGYTLSAPLVEELFQRLSTSGLVTMLQGEIQHQPPPVTCPENKPAEPPDAIKK